LLLAQQRQVALDSIGVVAARLLWRSSIRRARQMHLLGQNEQRITRE
jgi:hypothetical protein